MVTGPARREAEQVLTQTMQTYEEALLTSER
jgi:hypothetical protein